MIHASGTARTRQIAYLPTFLSVEENEELVVFLNALPRSALGDYNPACDLAFVRPVYDGVEITGREELASGEPIWYKGVPTAGVRVPDPLRHLAAAVTAALRQEGIRPDKPFTSVYVDRYERGGSFAPHTDRSCYGPIVAGVSVGEGRAVLEFKNSIDSRSVSLDVEPRSLYAFWGPLRSVPWTHGVREVTSLRYGVTFRSHRR